MSEEAKNVLIAACGLLILVLTEVFRRRTGTPAEPTKMGKAISQDAEARLRQSDPNSDSIIIIKAALRIAEMSQLERSETAKQLEILKAEVAAIRAGKQDERDDPAAADD